MQQTTKRRLIGLALAVIVGPPLFIASYMSLGLAFAPAWPKPAASHVIPLVGDALWVRAYGGPAAELKTFNPITIGQFGACILAAELEDDAALQDARQAACQRQHLPPLGALEYLSTTHLRDTANMTEPGFKEGHARFVTTVWMARSFTKADLVDTLAERGEFGMGFKGFEAAARGYFGRTTAQLTLPQVAMIAALITGRGPDPWCDPAGAAALRHRILTGMLENHAIDEPAFTAADRSELGLTPPPAGHLPCKDLEAGISLTRN